MSDLATLCDGAGEEWTRQYLMQVRRAVDAACAASRYRPLTARLPNGGRVQSAAMPNRTNEETYSRTEARRRARLAARGFAPEQDDGDVEAPRPTPPPRGGFLTRIFPPAPPLPGRPDPLAGFRYQGALRPVLSGLYLLARNPLAWIVPGLVWMLASLVDPRNFAGLVASLLSFGVLIAAGWYGWQRPWLFGLAAAVLGFVAQVGVVLYFFTSQGAAGALPLDQVALSVALRGFIQGTIGFLSGWYGGYLRRRQAQVRTEPPRPRTRR